MVIMTGGVLLALCGWGPGVLLNTENHLIQNVSHAEGGKKPRVTSIPGLFSSMNKKFPLKKMSVSVSVSCNQKILTNMRGKTHAGALGDGSCRWLAWGDFTSMKHSTLEEINNRVGGHALGPMI